MHRNSFTTINEFLICSTQDVWNACVSGAYTEIVIRGGGPRVEVEVNLVSAEGASCYRPRGVWGHTPPGESLKYLSQMEHYKSI